MDWDSVRNKLKRAGVKFDYYAVRSGDNRRFFAIVVTDGAERVPAELTPCRGIDLGSRLMDAIDQIPVKLPKNTRVFQAGGNWEKLCDPCAPFAAAPPKAKSVADLQLVSFKNRHVDDDELIEELGRIEDRYQIDLHIQRGVIDNDHRGGDISDSVAWDVPEDENAAEDIEEFLRGPELASVADGCSDSEPIPW